MPRKDCARDFFIRRTSNRSFSGLAYFVTPIVSNYNRKAADTKDRPTMRGTPNGQSIRDGSGYLNPYPRSVFNFSLLTILNPASPPSSNTGGGTPILSAWAV